MSDEILEKENSSKIMEMNGIIINKDKEINELKLKVIKLGKNNNELKLENEQLKTELKQFKKKINDNKLIYPKNKLLIQPTQRFIVFKESTINNDEESFINYINSNNSGDKYKESNLSNNDFNDLKENKINISNNFTSKMTPFKMQPYKIFDHRKLDLNYKDFEKNFLDEDLLNEIKYNNNSIINSMTLHNYSIEQNDNSNLSSERKSNNKNNSEGIKLHSSLFFKNCKNIMNKNEYGILLEIVKLSNAKQITKEETYLKITNLLDNNYPELSNEFKLLFI